MKINIDRLLKEPKENIAKKMNLGLDILSKSIEEKTPVDTGTYKKGNKQNKAVIQGDKITASVYNDSEYAGKVEYGFRTTREVNWHKNRKAGGPVIYTGVGARTYTRTYLENEQKIINLLK